MSDNIQVAIRLRPLNEKEITDTQRTKFIQVNKATNSIIITVNSSLKQFSFDYVAEEEVSQEELFESIGKPISMNCLTGYNSSIFAYGQTGAGKTYTIIGDYQSISLKKQNSGILPRCLEYIFSYIDDEKKGNLNIDYLVKCSFLEIYNEQIHDLLVTQQRNLPIREDIKKGSYIEDLTQETVLTLEEVTGFMKKGIKNRHVSSTLMNKESSRSHSVFTVYIESKEKKDELWNFKNSLFHLIDLAGSERQKIADTHGDRLKEASMINKSLSTLGNVINSLVEISEGKSRYVRYRDSKLTFLLKDSLGGNSKTCIIANISPSVLNYGETLSTLRFAERAKFVKNQAVINEDSIGTILELKEEVKKLRSILKNNTKEEFRVTDNKRLQDLEELLEKNLRIRLQTESTMQQEIENKENYLKSLTNTLEKYEKKMHGDKMTLKLREDTIRRLQKGEKLSESEVLSDLKQEMQYIRRENENHPIAAKYFVENDALKHHILMLENELGGKPNSLISRMKANQEFTEKLNFYLEEYSKDKQALEDQLKKTSAKASVSEDSLKQAHEHIADLCSELEQEKQKIISLEEQLFKNTPEVVFDGKENIFRNKIETIKLADITVKPNLPNEFHYFRNKTNYCKDCECKTEEIAN